jgi:heme/copper-type cytochrome/quinol oxidase subunit 2
MGKWLMLILFCVASAMALVFSFTAALEPAEGGGEAGGKNEVLVTGKNWEFNQSEYTAYAGEPIKITYRNEAGGGIHGMLIEGTDVNLKNGESAEITLEPGEYAIKCSIMCGDGHDTMVSKLIVLAEDAGEAAGAGSH